MMPDGEDPAELAALVDKANDYIDNSPAELRESRTEQIEVSTEEIGDRPGLVPRVPEVHPAGEVQWAFKVACHPKLLRVFGRGRRVAARENDAGVVFEVLALEQLYPVVACHRRQGDRGGGLII